MNIKASYGCYLTQSKDIPLRDRLFVDQISISSIDEVKEWKQVTKDEKREIEEREAFFDVDKVDMSYLHKMDNVISKVAVKVNDAHLTNDEALEMQKYYPKWEDIIGKLVDVGFRFVCDGILFEVVEQHVVSEDRKPTMQVMTLALMPDEEPAPSYYKKVISSAEEAEMAAREEAAQAEKNINNKSKF